MKIAHFGTFDVLNYGDLLFPIVAEHYLSAPGVAFEWVSPKGGPPVCADAVPTTGVLDVPWDRWRFDLALIGGGNIVHPHPTTLPAYAKPLPLPSLAYPALWLSACLKAVECGAAIAWNAPGAMNEGTAWPPGAATALTACLKASDYVAFRATTGLHGIDPGVRDAVRNVPDTVAALPRVWPKASLAPNFAALGDRLGLQAPYFIVHLKARNLPSPQRRKAAAAAIDLLALATDLVPVLLPIGRCHGDGEFLRLMRDELGPRAILAEEASGLRDMTALIAHAEYVFAASLHCALVAAAYGVPTRALSFKPLLKHRAFFETHLGMGRVVVDDVEDGLAPHAFSEAVIEKRAMRVATGAAADAVEAHFAAISAIAREPSMRSERGEEARDRLFRAINGSMSIAPYFPLGVTQA